MYRVEWKSYNYETNVRFFENESDAFDFFGVLSKNENARYVEVDVFSCWYDIDGDWLPIDVYDAWMYL